MNTDISAACVCYGLYDNETIIGFMGVLHQPNAHNTQLKRVSRLVILPDYQGVGLGYKFLCCVGNYYINKGYSFSIVTSAKNLIWKLYLSNKWKMTGLCKSHRPKTPCIEHTSTSIRTNCKTGRFQYEP